MATTTDYIDILGRATSALAALTNVSKATKTLGGLLDKVVDSETKQQKANDKTIASYNRGKKAIGGLTGEMKRQLEVIYAQEAALKTRNVEANKIVTSTRNRFNGGAFDNASPDTQASFTPILTSLKRLARETGITKTRYDELFAAISTGGKIAASNLEAAMIPAIKQVVALLNQQTKAQQAEAALIQKSTGALLAKLAVARELGIQTQRNLALQSQRQVAGDIVTAQFTPTNLASGTTVAEFNKITQAVGRLNALVLTGKANVGQIQVAYAKFASGTAQALTPLETRLFSMFRGISAATAQAGGTAQREADRIIKANNAHAASVDALINKWSFFARLLLVQQIHLVVGRLTSAMFESVRAASEFQIKLSQIRTISQDAQVGFNALAKQINEVAIEFGTSNVDTAAAAYQIVTDQVAQGTKAMSVLRAASRLALIGVSDVATSAKTLGALINAFQLSANEAEHLTDVVFRLADVARTTVGELGDIGNLMAVAAPLGLAFEEVGAAIAVISRQGVSSETTMTNLSNLFNRMLKPSKALQAVLLDMGFNSPRQAIAAKGFLGIMKELFDLGEKTGEGSELLADLFPDLRGQRAAQNLVRNPELQRQFARDEEKLRNPGTVAANASTIIFESSAKQLQKQVNALGITLQENFGAPLILVLNEAGKLFGGLNKLVLPILDTVKNLAGGWLLVAVATKTWGAFTKAATVSAMSGLTSVNGQLATAAVKSRLAAVGMQLFAAVKTIGLSLAIGFIIDAMIKAKIASAQARENLEQFNATFREANKNAEVGGFRQAFIDNQKAIKEAARLLETEYSTVLSDIRKILNAIGKDQDDAAKKMQKSFKEAAKTIQKEMTKAANVIEKEIAKAQKALDRVKDISKDSAIDFDSSVFERAFDGLTKPQAQLDALIARTNTLRTQLTALENKENPTAEDAEEILRLYAAINALLNKRFNINNDIATNDKKTSSAREEAQKRLLDIEKAFIALQETKLKFLAEEQKRREAIILAEEKKGAAQGAIFDQLDANLAQFGEATLDVDGLASMAEALEAIKKLNLSGKDGAGLDRSEVFNLTQQLEAKKLLAEETVARLAANEAVQLSQKKIQDFAAALENLNKAAGDAMKVATDAQGELAKASVSLFGDLQSLFKGLAPEISNPLTTNPLFDRDQLNFGAAETRLDPKIKEAQAAIDAFADGKTAADLIAANDRLKDAFFAVKQEFFEAFKKAQSPENVTAAKVTLQSFEKQIAKFTEAIEAQRKTELLQQEAKDALARAQIDAVELRVNIQGLKDAFDRGQVTTIELINALMILRDTINDSLPKTEPEARLNNRRAPLIPDSETGLASAGTSIGDINITVTGIDAKPENVIAFGRALRREIQRGTVNLNVGSTA